jgi:hypothetical protein
MWTVDFPLEQYFSTTVVRQVRMTIAMTAAGSQLHGSFVAAVCRMTLRLSVGRLLIAPLQRPPSPPPVSASCLPHFF